MPGGDSILMTLAPQSASCRTQVGPARTRVRSSTVIRARAFEARGKGIANSPINSLTDKNCGRADRTSTIPIVLSTGLVYRHWRSASFAPRAADTDRLKWTRRRPSFRHFGEAIMNEDVFNVSVRKFLKKVGITSQREIEKAVRAAVASGRLKGHEALPAKMTLAVEAVGLAVEIDGAIELE